MSRRIMMLLIGALAGTLLMLLGMLWLTERSAEYFQTRASEQMLEKDLKELAELLRNTDPSLPLCEPLSDKAALLVIPQPQNEEHKALMRRLAFETSIDLARCFRSQLQEALIQEMGSSAVRALNHTSRALLIARHHSPAVCLKSEYEQLEILAEKTKEPVALDRYQAISLASEWMPLINDLLARLTQCATQLQAANPIHVELPSY